MGKRNKKKPKLECPHLPNEKNEGLKYEITTYAERLVCEHTNLNINEIEELNIVEFALYLRDAYIIKCYKTEKGTEYLNKCFRMKQTEPDRDALRNKFRKGE